MSNKRGAIHNFGDFIFKQIFGNTYPTFTAVGWTQIELDAPITEKYRSVSMAIENDAELREQILALNAYADTDEDGLLDLEEIYYDRGETAVIKFNENGEAILPTFRECMELENSLFYVESGFNRFTDSMGELLFYQLDSIRILPIKSDPTNLDSDEDGFIDIYDPNKLIYNEHYDREKVKDYASTWAESRNPIYPGDEVFETDCTNFVSQCVESGGYPMDENWYIIKKNIDITYISSKVWSIIVDHFDENDTYVKNGWRMSTSWGKARLNCEYFSGLNEGNVIKVSDYISIDNEFITANNIQVGDLLYFCEGDDAVHATVITELTGDKIKYSGHTYDRNNVELEDFSESYSCINIIKIEEALPWSIK